jgi:hypothetical protein
MTRKSEVVPSEVSQSLAEMGLKPSTYRALLLLPLVYVAWADGKMEHVEVQLIESFARERLHLTADTVAILDGWLKARPSDAFVRNGLEKLLGIALDEEVIEVDVSELPDLLVHAEAIARATANSLNDPMNVTPEEEKALGEIARLLEVDSGATWGELLRTLRTDYPSAKSAG